MTIHCFGTRIGCDCDRIELEIVDSLCNHRIVTVTHGDVLFNHYDENGEQFDYFVSREVPFLVHEAKFYRGNDLLVDIHA